jgi:1-acyl-sn-glycerol-3-phosphate acyltransferase
MAHGIYRSKLRSFVMVSAGILLTGILMVTIIPVGIFSPLGRTLHAFERFWAGCLIKLAGIRARARGMEHIQEGKTYIFISNHQSAYDIPLMIFFSPKQLRMIYKKELMWIPLMGFVLWLLKFIAIDRGNREKAAQSLTRAARKIRDGINLVIFADGTRSLDGELRPFKKGAFVLAINAQVDIIPVTISGTINVMHKYRSFFDISFHREVEIVFSPPVPTSNLTQEHKDQLMEAVASQISATYETVKQLSKIDDPDLLEKIGRIGRKKQIKENQTREERIL